MPAPTYPKRLIEVDLPIKKISEHARREKSIRHGHISTLHLWWARRPLAACRAVICAALWPDPADPLCPERFRTDAEDIMGKFWNPMGVTDKDFSDSTILRQALLDFIADFSNWDNSTDERYLLTAQKLTQVAYESLGGEPGSKPLVVDPFAGGGSIPLEALRVGADTYASDLNPVAVLLNAVTLGYIPKYGKELADEVRKWGRWVKNEAEKELSDLYPDDLDGAKPIAYLWARTIRCEGPSCGAEVPLIRSLWLAKKGTRSVGLRLVPDKEKKWIDFEIIENAKPRDIKEGTVKRGSATCPVCGFTTPIASIRAQLKQKNGGANDSRMFCVVTVRPGQQGRNYRLPVDSDIQSFLKGKERLIDLDKKWKGKISLIPDEFISLNEIRRISVPLYGINQWGDMFNFRQKLAILTLVDKIKSIQYPSSDNEKEKILAVKVLLALSLSRLTDLSNSLTRWKTDAECPVNLFSRQAIPMVWDYPEIPLTSSSSGSWLSMYERTAYAVEVAYYPNIRSGQIEQINAIKHTLPSDSADLFCTDPPYYDAVPYAYLSDFFYVWLRRILINEPLSLFHLTEVPKMEEIVVDRPHFLSKSNKDIKFYERNLCLAFQEGRRICRFNGMGVLVFASKTTASWEAIIQAVIDSGWILTGSWPIDTEMATRIAAKDQARLASSIHLVCRPRENPDGSLREEIGDWRDILSELPSRIHEWMPRLAKEGVVGADAIFACLGPALEVYSRYSKVEKASGEEVPLREYLEYVWAAVSREALGMIFEGADATGFEEDARITAMWLWTLKTAESPALNGKNGNGIKEQQEESEEEEGEEAEGSGKKKVKGFSLEYDAARKIAQGLGAHLEEMHTLVEIKKGNARLLPVAERAAYLLKSEKEKPVRRPKKKEKQSTLFPLELEGEEVTEEDFGDVAEIGKTTLDRVHQSMLLFAAGQSDALKRFLVDEGIGKNAQFWKLAQALAALYPSGTEEKRWVEGVLARKKGLGL